MTNNTTTEKISVAQYLCTRLDQLGVGTIFGVPGDYNLSLLDTFGSHFGGPINGSAAESLNLNGDKDGRGEEGTRNGGQNGREVEEGSNAKVKFLGTTNELNAAYAADGYARINGLGVLLTTFGVGELSAINGIAGAYAELVPMLHVVGTPKRIDQFNRVNVHHTLGDGEYGRFKKCAEQVSVAVVDLGMEKRETWTERIDWVLGTCLRESRPVYLCLPDDVVALHVDAGRLREGVNVAGYGSDGPNEFWKTDEVGRALRRVEDRVKNCKKPAILVDGESRACGILGQVDTFVRRSGWPTFTSGFGKGLVNETYPNVHGVYTGRWNKYQKEYVDSADLILVFGPHYSKTNTYLGSSIPDPKVTISWSPKTMSIDGETIVDISPRLFLDALMQALDLDSLCRPEINSDEGKLAKLKYIDDIDLDPTEPVSPDSKLDHGHMWPRFNPLLKSGDVIIGETGTPGYGVRVFKLPPQTYFTTMATWLSIGYTLPAALGAAVAQRQRLPHGNNARTYLFIGDGSLQLTVQEISTMLRLDLPITIVVINNDGYTVERCIHGKDRRYNDIAMWNYTRAASFFSRRHDNDTDNGEEKIVRTYAELDKVIAKWQQEKDQRRGFEILEVVTDKFDAPKVLKDILGMQIAATSSQSSS